MRAEEAPSRPSGRRLAGRSSCRPCGPAHPCPRSPRWGADWGGRPGAYRCDRPGFAGSCNQPMLTPKTVTETTPLVVEHTEQRHELAERRRRRIAEEARLADRRRPLLDAARVERAAA